MLLGNAKNTSSALSMLAKCDVSDMEGAVSNYPPHNPPPHNPPSRDPAPRNPAPINPPLNNSLRYNIPSHNLIPNIQPGAPSRPTGKATKGNIRILISEGFSEDDVIDTLNQTSNDVTEAREALSVNSLG